MNTGQHCTPLATETATGWAAQRGVWPAHQERSSSSLVSPPWGTSKPTPWLGQGSVCPLITSSTVPCSRERRTGVVLSPTPPYCLAAFTGATSSCLDISLRKSSRTPEDYGLPFPHQVIHGQLTFVPSCAKTSHVPRQLSSMATFPPSKTRRVFHGCHSIAPSTCCHAMWSLSCCITLRIGTIIFVSNRSWFLSQLVSITAFSFAVHL